MRSLVTGGAGFIGSHLVEALVSAGDDVRVLDDLSTGSLDNLSGVADRVEIVRGSVVDRDVVLQAARDVDRIFHLACAVGVELVARDPATTLWSNVAGTEHVADAAEGSGAVLVYTSSSEVYGAGCRFPLREDDGRLLGPTSELRWSYSDGKAVGELLVLARAGRGARSVVVRLFNTVGPRQLGAHGMVLPRFVRAALDGAAIEVHGNGRQTRSFCHVGDVVPALIALSEEPGALGRVVNLGSEHEISVRELAELVRRTLDSSSPIQHVPHDQVPGREIDFVRRVPDTTVAHRLIGFRATTSLDDVIRAVASSMR